VETLREQVAYLQGVIATRDQELALRAEEIRRRDTALEREQQLAAMFADHLQALEAPASSSEVQESDVSPGPTGKLEEVQEELAAEQDRREMAETTLHEGMAEEQRRREEAERERDELRQELHALREPRESPEPGEEQQGRGRPHSDRVESQEAVQRSWWRRVFGR
jgi:DNA repair exonuclease SbcCD ATPase subunit